MSLQACAELVARGDPDRFRAAMAAPLAARPVLLPFYAFNVEVARAPWVSAEPLIAEIRLQWWADALGEIAAGGQVRRHEVASPLAKVLLPDDVSLLQCNVAARRRDAQRVPIGSVDAWRGYLSDTSGALLWAVTRALAREEGRGRDLHGDAVARARSIGIGCAQGLANYLLAVPEFVARGINPLPEMTGREFNDLLDEMLRALRQGRAKATRLQRIAELAAWRARGVLARARADHAAVPEGRLDEAPISRDLSLFWRRLRL
ncbi:MAG: squalene/phytoene synthase family protein [Pseudomonadota bacterium]